MGSHMPHGMSHGIPHTPRDVPWDQIAASRALHFACFADWRWLFAIFAASSAAGDPERHLGQAGRRASRVGLPPGGGQLRGSHVLRPAPVGMGEEWRFARVAPTLDSGAAVRAAFGRSKAALSRVGGKLLVFGCLNCLVLGVGSYLR